MYRSIYRKAQELFSLVKQKKKKKTTKKKYNNQKSTQCIKSPFVTQTDRSDQ